MSEVITRNDLMRILEKCGVDHLSVDSNGYLKIDTGMIADSFNGLILDVDSNNTTDTWVPVFRENIIQHRVIPRDIFTARLVQATINREYMGNVSITAPAIDDYTFVAWGAVATAGWIGSCYVEDATAVTSRIWNASTGQSGDGLVHATALYKANF